MHKFAPLCSPKSLYLIKLVGLSERANFYSKECSGEGISWKSPGVCCIEYNDLWKISGPKLKQNPVKKHGVMFCFIVIALHTPTLNETDAKILENLTCTNDTDLSKECILSPTKAAVNYAFYQQAKVRVNYFIHYDYCTDITYKFVIFKN